MTPIGRARGAPCGAAVAAGTLETSQPPPTGPTGAKPAEHRGRRTHHRAGRTGPADPLVGAHGVAAAPASPAAPSAPSGRVAVAAPPASARRPPSHADCPPKKRLSPSQPRTRCGADERNLVEPTAPPQDGPVGTSTWAACRTPARLDAAFVDIGRAATVALLRRGQLRGGGHSTATSAHRATLRPARRSVQVTRTDAPRARASPSSGAAAATAAAPGDGMLVISRSSRRGARAPRNIVKAVRPELRPDRAHGGEWRPRSSSRTNRPPVRIGAGRGAARGQAP